MSSNHRPEMMGASLQVSICFLSILSLFAIPANAQHVHQLLYNNYNWTDQNLVGEPIYQENNPDVPTGIAAFTTSPNNQVHVYYVGADGHVHQRTQSQIRFFGLTRWVDEDLTLETGGDPVAYPTDLAAFSIDNLQYVFLRNGYNDDVHMLFYNNSTWTDQDISVAAGSPGACLSGVIVAFTTTPNNQFHVYYQGGNFEVRQLFFNGTNWSDENLSAETGGPQTQPGYWAGFSIGNYQYLFYVDAESFDLHELSYNNIGWTDIDLSAQIGAPKPAGAWAMAGFVVPGTQTMEVFYTDSSYHMYKISSSDNVFWSQQDLTTLTDGPSAEPSDPLTAFATTPNDQLHVYYVSETRHVNQLFFNGSSWSNTDLTSQIHAGNVVYQAGMSGFSLGNYQYVYYGSN
jgi:hypothetical protein